MVMFICNHCPYVKAIRDRIVRDTNELQTLRVNSVAIMANDPTEIMPRIHSKICKRVTEQFDFPFPYLLDDTQDVAKAYGAVCTPDFFGYNADFGLQYRAPTE